MSKKGQPWNREEEDAMLDMLRKGEGIDSVAGILQRTSKAILWRLGLYCQKAMRTKKRSLEQLCAEFHSPVAILQDVLEQLEIQHGGTGATTTTKHNGHDNIAELILLVKTIHEEVGAINTRVIRISKNVKKLQEELQDLKINNKKK